MENTKTHSEAVQKLAQLIGGMHTAMLTTQGEGGKLESRPMAVQSAEFDGTLYFLTKRSSGKVQQVEEYPQVNVAFADPGKNNYVSIAGKAKAYHDQATIDRLWSPLNKAWFPDGKDDPTIEVLEIDAESAEYWDSPSSTFVQLFGFVKATLTGTPANGGENERVKL